MAPDASWRPVTAVQTIALGAPGFTWLAEADALGPATHVLDAFGGTLLVICEPSDSKLVRAQSPGSLSSSRRSYSSRAQSG